MQKIKVKSVRVTGSELKMSGDYRSLADFDSAVMRHIPHDYDGLGYFKTHFLVTFDDGFEYAGRYDAGCDRPTLAAHIRAFCAYYAKYQPRWAEFLEKYEI